jgi:copper chaperone
MKSIDIKGDKMALKLKVPSMKCEECADSITQAVKVVDDQAKVDVDLDNKTVTLESEASEESFKQAIVAAGYPIEE